MDEVTELVLDEDRIARYFRLDKDIQFIKRRIKEIEIEFMHRNFYTCIQQMDETVRTVAFKVDKEVIDHVTGIENAKRKIEILTFKRKHFKRYLSSLDYESNYYFTQRYKHNWEIINDKLDREIMEEIKEIETATIFHFNPTFGYIIEKPKEVSEEFHVTDEDPDEYMERMMEMMGID